MKIRDFVIKMEAKFYALLLILFPVYEIFATTTFPFLRDYLPDNIYRIMGLVVVMIGFFKAVYLSKTKKEDKDDPQSTGIEPKN